MEKRQYVFLLISSSILSLGLSSFGFCIVAESKKSKEEDVKLNNHPCSLPEGRAFGFGIAALICLIVAQIIGKVVIVSVTKFCSSGDNRNSIKAKSKKPAIAATLLVLSWISFGLAVILLSTATSMSRRQSYGKGWLDQECYLVKDGVYIGSGLLVLVSVAATLSSAILIIRRVEVEQGHRAKLLQEQKNHIT